MEFREKNAFIFILSRSILYEKLTMRKIELFVAGFVMILIVVPVSVGAITQNAESTEEGPSDEQVNVTTIEFNEIDRDQVDKGEGEVADTDHDGLMDDEEVQLGTNPNCEDTDGDNLDDGAEVNWSGTDPTDTDSDDDGWSDLSERNRGYDPLDAESHP